MLRTDDPIAAARDREALLPPHLRGGVAMRRTTVERLGGCDVAVHRWGADGAPATLVLVHGGGGNGLLLAPLGVLAQREGFAAVAPDLPGYGLSRQPGRTRIRYDDWRRVVHDLVVAEHGRSGRPIVALGLSMGGRLAYEATATSGVPSWLVVTNLLEPTDPAVRPALTRWRWMGRVPPRLMGVGGPLGDRLPVPMRWVADMAAIANDPRWVRALVADRSASGAWVPLGFLRTFLTEPPAVHPSRFTTCPVTLAQPGDDRWTPLEASLPMFRAITQVPTDVVTLDRCGHLPVEEPGASVLASLLVERLRRAASLPT